METKKTKKEIVQMLLKKKLDTKDEEELINMLLDEPISVDVDKQSPSFVVGKNKKAYFLLKIGFSFALIYATIILYIKYR